MKRLIFLLSFVLMGSSLPTLKYRAQDNAGNALSGAKLYFYIHGTTTPKATYSNEGLTSANANPVVADSAGWFGEIYLSTDDAYKVVLKTSAGVTVWTLDNVNATQLVGTATQTRLLQIASSPLDYGAVGDGAADEAASVQAAINAATGVVDLLGKTYRCDSMISLRSGLTLRNGYLDFSNAASNSYISVSGTVSTPVLLTADVSAGDSVVYPDAGGSYAAGDWVYIESGDNWAVGTGTYGELFQVESFVGGMLTLDRQTLSGFSYTSAPGIYKLAPVESVIIEDVTLYANPAASGSGNAISLLYAANTVLRDLWIDGPVGSGISVDKSANTTIENVTVTNGGTNAVGVYLRDGNLNASVSKSSFYNLHDGVKMLAAAAGTDGVTVGVSVTKSTFERCAYPLYITDSAEAVVVDGNHINNADSTYGVYVANSDSIVRNNTIAGSSSGYGVYVAISSPATDIKDYIIVRGNVISGTYFGVAVADLATPKSSVDGVLIDNNELSGTSDSYGAIVYSGTSNSVTYPAKKLSVSHNTIAGSFKYGVSMSYGNDIEILQNTIVSTSTNATAGVYVYRPKASAEVVGNSLRGMNNSGNYNILVATDATNAPALHVAGNIVDTAVGGISITSTIAGAKVSVEGNVISATQNGVLLASTTYSLSAVSISGNVVSSTAGASYIPVSVTGTAAVGSITGNVLSRTDDLAPALKIDADSAAAIANFAVSGNSFNNGTHSIDTDAATSVISGNTYTGYATGRINANSVAYTTGQGVNILNVQAADIPSDGAGTSAAYTLTPTTSYVAMTCADPQGCVVTMSETGAQEGQLVTIVFSGTQGSIFAYSAGVLLIPEGSGGELRLMAGDSLTLQYSGSTWVQLARSQFVSTCNTATVIDNDSNAGTSPTSAPDLGPPCSRHDILCSDPQGCNFQPTISRCYLGQKVSFCAAPTFSNNIDLGGTYLVVSTGFTARLSSVGRCIQFIATNIADSGLCTFTVDNY